MEFFRLVLGIEHWIVVGLSLVGLVLEIWAFVDCLTRSPASFDRAGIRQSKSFWMLLTGIGLAIGLLSGMGSLGGSAGGLGILSIAALCVAAVYLAGPRRQMRLYGSGNTYGY